MSGKPNLNQTRKITRSSNPSIPSQAKERRKKNSSASTESDFIHTPTTTKSSKRKVSTSPSSTEVIQAAKRTTNNLPENQMADDIRNLFEEFTKNMQKQFELQANQITQTITSTVQREVNLLGEQLKKDFRTQLADLDQKIDAHKTSVDDKLETMQKKVDSCVNGAVSDNDIHRITKLCELKIRGIPHTAGENLLDIFTSIAQFIGYEMSMPNNMPILTRIQSRKKDTNERVHLPFITVKFVAKHIRDGFYSLYLSKAINSPLMTEHINLAPGNRVIISENLTIENQKIFGTAMKMKIDGKLTKVFTKDGLVLVKKAGDSKAHTIRTSRDLDLHTIEAASSSQSSAKPNNSTNSTMSVSNGSTATTPMQP